MEGALLLLACVTAILGFGNLADQRPVWGTAFLAVSIWAMVALILLPRLKRKYSQDEASEEKRGGAE